MPRFTSVSVQIGQYDMPLPAIFERAHVYGPLLSIKKIGVNTRTFSKHLQKRPLNNLDGENFAENVRKTRPWAVLKLRSSFGGLRGGGNSDVRHPCFVKASAKK